MADYFNRQQTGKDTAHSYQRTVDKLTYTSKAKYKLKNGVREFYHGCDPFMLAKILSEGLKPPLGEGAGELRACYGVPVPGVYLSPTFEMAQWFPCSPTTGPIKLPKEDEAEYAGGSLISTDGAFPLRAVIRVIAHESISLRRNPGYTYLYKPESLFIKHVFW